MRNGKQWMAMELMFMAFVVQALLALIDTDHKLTPVGTMDGLLNYGLGIVARIDEILKKVKELPYE